VPMQRDRHRLWSNPWRKESYPTVLEEVEHPPALQIQPSLQLVTAIIIIIPLSRVLM
jgi:hypothetical protein